MELPTNYFVKNSEKNSKDKSKEKKGLDLELLVVRSLEMTQDFLTTGCPKLDLVLKDGIPTFGITEIIGESATGKTQLCLQLAITAQLGKEENGLDSAVLYLCTEDVLPTKRLQELTVHFQKLYGEKLPANPMDYIYVEHLGDSVRLMECLELRLPLLIKRQSKKIRLLILDSVAGIFRIHDGDFMKRTNGLRRLGQTLHKFSSDHEAAIVVCNQVTANVLQGQGNIAALGLAWKNLVTTRIRMSRCDNDQYRYLQMEFSPHAPSTKVPITIVSGGIRASDGPPGSGLYLF